MIFELAQDFHDALAAMPKEHPKHRMLELLEEAIRRDIHFIARHPTTMFQCMWNTCWWYHCPEAVKHYVESEGGGSTRQDVPASARSDLKLSCVLSIWRKTKEELTLGFPWVRSLRPPVIRLGSSQIALLEGHHAAVNAVDITADQSRAVSVSDDHTIKIWDIADGRCLSTFDCGAEAGLPTLYAFNRIRISADGSWAVCKRRVSDIDEIWNLTSGQVQSAAPAHLGLSLPSDVQWRGPVRKASGITNEYKHDQCLGVTESPEPGPLAFVADGRGVQLYDLHADRLLTRLAGRDTPFSGKWSVYPYSNNAAMTPNGEMALCADVRGTIYLWSVASQRLIGIFTGHSQPVCGFAVAADGTRFISAGEDHTLRVWSLLAPDCSAVGHNEPTRTVFFSGDGTYAVTESCDGVRCGWDLRTGQRATIARVERPAQGGSQEITYAVRNVDVRHIGHTVSALSRNGRTAVTGEVDYIGSTMLRVYEAESGRTVRMLRHAGGVHCMKVAHEGRLVISCSHKVFNDFNMSTVGDNSMRVWDVRTGKCRFLARNEVVNEIVLTPDEEFVVSVSEDRWVRIRDLSQGRIVMSFATHGSARWVALAPGGRHVLIGDSMDGTYVLELIGLSRESCAKASEAEP